MSPPLITCPKCVVAGLKLATGEEEACQSTWKKGTLISARVNVDMDMNAPSFSTPIICLSSGAERYYICSSLLGLIRWRIGTPKEIDGAGRKFGMNLLSITRGGQWLASHNLNPHDTP